MRKTIEERVQAAEQLYRQAVQRDITRGCLEVSLVALGADITIDDVDPQQKETHSLIEAIEGRGFLLNWWFQVDNENLPTPLTSQDMADLFQGRFTVEEDFPTQETAGYLFVQFFPGQTGHVIAILPYDPDKPNRYYAIDTNVGTLLPLTADNLAHLANYTLAEGGRFEVAQLKRAS